MSTGVNGKHGRKYNMQICGQEWINTSDVWSKTMGKIVHRREVEFSDRCDLSSFLLLSCGGRCAVEADSGANIISQLSQSGLQLALK